MEDKNITQNTFLQNNEKRKSLVEDINNLVNSFNEKSTFTTFSRVSIENESTDEATLVFIVKPKTQA